MIGRGRFNLMTTRLRGAGIPGVGAQKFSDLLFKQIGCRLAWHKQRRVFVVYRDRGRLAPPRTYMDLGNEHFPLTGSVLDFVLHNIRFTDALSQGDTDRLVALNDKRRDELNTSAHRRLLEEMHENYKKDFDDIARRIAHKRIMPKYYTVGAAAS